MEERVISSILKDVTVPKMIKVRQRFERPKIEVSEIPSVILDCLAEEKFSSLVKPGMKICITAGSRGIANIALITKTIADFCKFQGAEPFVVPAMGSHGGGTAEGQREILASLGITEKTVGCPIISSMETVVVGYSPEGLEVRIDKNAAEADGK